MKYWIASYPRSGNETQNRESFFRVGKIKTWKKDMPKQLQQIFSHLHGEALKQNDYTEIVKAKNIYVKLTYQRLLWLIGFIKEKLRH